MTNKLIIECNLKSSLNFTNHKIKWYKDDVEIRQSFVPSGGIPTTYEQHLDENSGKLSLIVTYPMNTDCGLYRCCILDKNLQKVDETSHLVYKMFNPPPHVPFETLDIGEKKNLVVFDNYLSNITAEEGSRTVRLNCKVSQCNAQSEIKWYKNNEELPIDYHREKYRFTKSYNRLCLEILNIGMSDAGTYECRVRNQYNEISSKCNVYVNEKIDRHRSRATPRGKIISFQLKKLHFHVIMYTFSFAGTSFPDLLSDISSVHENSNKILLEKHERDDVARSRRSPIPYDSFDPSIERPIFATPISDRTITENSATVKFTCSVLSSDCDISWEKNGIPIRPSSKHRQTFSDGLAILEIYDATDDDAGKYSCVASNKHGESITSAKLKVYSGFKPTVSMPPSVSRQMKGRFYRARSSHSSLHCFFFITKLRILQNFFYYFQLTLCLFAHDCNIIISFYKSSFLEMQQFPLLF